MIANIHSPAQRREFIKYQLRLQGTTLAEVGRELGVTTATMSQVYIGARRSDRIISALADRLGLPLEALATSGSEEAQKM